MSDPTATHIEETAVTPAVEAASDLVAARLAEFTSLDTIAKIKALGVETIEDLAILTLEMLKDGGVSPIQAVKVIAGLGLAATPVGPAVGALDPAAELPEGAAPSAGQITGVAGTLGMDPTVLMLLMNGQAGDMDLSGLMPIPTIVGGYNPKLRNMFLMIMGQVESRLGVPIVVIDGDGSINRALTVEYIEGLEEGRDAAENNIYFDGSGTPHEVIRVGVDAQSIYDADPLDSTKALQKSGMGIGRVNWNGTSLEIKQVAFLAANKTHEIDPSNDAHLAWLRDHVKPGAGRLVFIGQAPRAIGEYNEASRTGSLPTLRVMLSRGPRRREIMPRRRRSSPLDLSGIGDTRDRGVE